MLLSVEREATRSQFDGERDFVMLKLGIVDTIVDIISIPFPPLIVVFTKSHNGTCK